MRDHCSADTHAPALGMQALTKRFGMTAVLRGLTLEVPTGEFLSVFGPNGAGKSTLLRILATLMRPTSGSLTVLGRDAAEDGAGIRRQIGVLLDQPLLFPTLTAAENLAFYGRMFAVDALRDRIEALLLQMNLWEHRGRLVGQLSRGMQQRLAIARALLHQPRLLLLDEPYTGLDQQGIAALTSIVRAFHHAGGTVIMVSHDFSLGVSLCTRAVILARGRVAYDGSPAELDEPFSHRYHDCVSGRVGNGVME